MKRYLSLSLMLLFTGFVFSQDASAPATGEETTKYSYATVVSVSADQIVVSEYDYDKDEEVNVTYSVDANVQLKNVDALNKIGAGNYVEIEYEIKDGKKVAKVISLEKKEEEGEGTVAALAEEETPEAPAPEEAEADTGSVEAEEPAAE
ncbi:MAG: hypothetical protein JW774_13650 [Candidatus Aureabacteria bacterium]|nr:hypothetical protein [Candidatus Auribacterota bacterium]